MSQYAREHPDEPVRHEWITGGTRVQKRQTMTPQDRLYGLEHQEQLDTNIESVVGRVLDDACHYAGESFDAIAERVAWPIKVRVFRRMDVSKLKGIIAQNALEHVLELLDEEHADPDGDSAEPTAGMISASEAFAAAIVSDYVSWACEPTGEVVEITKDEARKDHQ